MIKTSNRVNKYIIGSFLLGLAFIGALLMVSRKDIRAPEVTSSTSASKLTVVEKPYDFGDIDIFAGKVSTNFTLKNEGSASVTITKAVTSCMCTEGEIDGQVFGMHGNEVRPVVIPGGETAVVKATYDPLAHGPNGVGPVTRTLQFETNSETTPKIELRFSANVIKTEG